ncbi:ATPase [Methanohalobium evestigatum Z-7303]|uniref:ATPase n=1 Tax=Methanohalobium evestigatum (strain ATCC BAA-1072 / DSM 3721 / NBRC 107634 / OCM 161 / Z-7303) TaxID=644295 RepID=D7E7J3_METEZ|nr:ATP-binding protein [Methanohalobium evestigatum]ADI74066.1 ATPase [Methanohalobium evestigatum Z-7303]
MKFYNREQELELMDTLYNNKPSMIVLTGKRRVGKTELIRQFMKDRDSIYFFVDSNKSIEILMQEFTSILKESLDLPDYIKLETPEQFLDFLVNHDKNLVVAIDEFQRFSKIYPSFIDQLQKYWDLKGENSNLFLIISGSSIGMIRKIFIEDNAPLFKRADNLLTLKPFTVKEVFEMLDDMGIRDFDEKLNLYFLFGGTVYYYRLFEKYQCSGFHDALEKLIFNDLAPLRDEVRDILIEEFGKEHSTYYEIVSAISQGKCSLTEISDMTHVSLNSLSHYFHDLTELLGVVEHKIPVTDTKGKSKHGKYFLTENFFRFYGYFLYPQLSLYKAGYYKPLLNKVQKEWKRFTGDIFESVMRDLITEDIIDSYSKVGPWWNRRGDEIDIVAFDEQNKKMLAVEVKNTELDENETRNILNSLSEKVKLVKGSSNMQIQLGVAAKQIENRELISDEGVVFWEMEDFLV